MDQPPRMAKGKGGTRRCPAFSLSRRFGVLYLAAGEGTSAEGPASYVLCELFA